MNVQIYGGPCDGRIVEGIDTHTPPLRFPLPIEYLNRRGRSNRECYLYEFNTASQRYEYERCEEWSPAHA